MEFIEHVVEHSSMSRKKVLKFIGLSRSRFYNWCQRKGMANRHNGKIPKKHWLLEEEVQAIVNYCRQQLEKGYRRLTYEMLDADIAAVSPASTYRILKKHGMLQRWAEKKTTSKGEGFHQATGPNQQWHVDISYIKVLKHFYFLITVLDGFSRRVMHHELREQMEEWDVQITVQRALEKNPEAQGVIISDNGPQFISKDFHDFIRQHELTHVTTSVYYPQSNGKLERFHGTIKQEEIRANAYLDIEDARRRVERYIRYYNEQRLHSSLYFLTPQEVFEGKMEARLAERQRKLDEARKRREEEAARRAA